MTYNYGQAYELEMHYYKCASGHDWTTQPVTIWGNRPEGFVPAYHYAPVGGAEDV